MFEIRVQKADGRSRTDKHNGSQKELCCFKSQSDICMIVPDVDDEAGDEGNHELDEDGHDTEQPNIHQLFSD